MSTNHAANPQKPTYGVYRCIERIRSRSQEVLYYAIHEETDQPVILRVMAITAPDAETALNRCKAQLAMIQQLDVPNVAPIDGYGSVDDDILYVATHYLPGGSLQRRMDVRHFGSSDDTPPALPAISEVLQLTERITTTLHAIHQQGTVHGQLDPSVILFDDAGNPFIAEVGFTRLTKIIFQLDTTNSLSMSRYSPPELWDGKRPSPATDQYALACLVYELLTGQAPFDSASIFELMKSHAEDVTPPPHRVRDDLPQDLAMVFWQALAKPTKRRFDSVVTFYDALHQSLQPLANDRSTDFFTFDLPS